MDDLKQVVVCSAIRDSKGKYVEHESTRADVVLRAYNRYKKANEEKIAQNRPNFWSTLWENLNQK